MLPGFMSPTARGGVGTRNNCNVLLRELQQIWNEMGESEADKDWMLSEIERECLEVYQRKLDEAANAKANLHQSVVAKEAEFATLMASLGELNLHSPKEKRAITLREHLSSLHPLVEELKLKKEERVKEFADLKVQIDKITAEISGYGHHNGSLYSLNLEEQDLSLRKLNDYQTHLRGLQRQKSDRLQKILGFVNEVHSLCGVLGLDFVRTIGDVHPSLHGTSVEQSTNISDSTVEGLEKTITRLKLERKNRYQKLKDIVSTLSELWNLMGSTKEEKQKLSGIVSIFRASGTEILKSGALSTENIEQALEEVERLTNLKASRMKELVMKKRSELEDLCRKIHVLPDPNTAPEKSSALIDSGLVDPCELMANIEAQIIRIKDEALSRKEIMDKIERWLSVCDEENWLEEYNQDDNRYNAVRGAHTNLKRAERARITVTKIPVMVDSLISKTLAWEDEHKKLFHYDGVRLVSILEDYKLARQQKEHEKKRQRDQKKLQDLLMTEKEALYGSKPSPRRSSSFRKTNGYRPNGNGSMTPTPRRNSLGGATPELLTPRSYSGRQNGYFREIRKLSTAPLNFVAIAKEDTISFSSICGSEPESPPLGSS
ncbi:65-kDa microtubule-associated protein 6-like isoform X2 [Impatiens glandulifera]|uniref:65-kDa microtubule-associated protein 6-like isoform X2 n=1 Tax=Impatiens glandulifera TaxID=253017 RepID=UPI001FB09821|nr:65-kDa microtubule-associated protein 6-like isoform X2 [Impatiens glandulifera]